MYPRLVACSVSKLCISITKTASAALLVFADRCVCVRAGLPTYYLHTLKRNLIVRVCVRADFISQRRGDTEWRRAK